MCLIPRIAQAYVCIWVALASRRKTKEPCLPYFSCDTRFVFLLCVDILYFFVLYEYVGALFDVLFSCTHLVVLRIYSCLCVTLHRLQNVKMGEYKY